MKQDVRLTCGHIIIFMVVVRLMGGRIFDSHVQRLMLLREDLVPRQVVSVRRIVGRRATRVVSVHVVLEPQEAVHQARRVLLRLAGLQLCLEALPVQIVDDSAEEFQPFAAPSSAVPLQWHWSRHPEEGSSEGTAKLGTLPTASHKSLTVIL